MARPDPTLSINCRAQHGMPHLPHEARCTGCEGCPCHQTTPRPGKVIETYKQRRVARGMPPRRTPDPGERGDAQPGPGSGGAAC